MNATYFRMAYSPDDKTKLAVKMTDYKTASIAYGDELHLMLTNTQAKELCDSLLEVLSKEEKKETA